MFKHDLEKIGSAVSKHSESLKGFKFSAKNLAENPKKWRGLNPRNPSFLDVWFHQNLCFIDAPQASCEDLSCNQGSPGCLCRHPVSIIGSIHATNFKPFMGIILILYEPCLPSSTLLRLQKRPKPRLPSWPRCLQHLQTDSVIMDFLVFYVR